MKIINNQLISLIERDTNDAAYDAINEDDWILHRGTYREAYIRFDMSLDLYTHILSRSLS